MRVVLKSARPPCGGMGRVGPTSQFLLNFNPPTPHWPRAFRRADPRTPSISLFMLTFFHFFFKLQNSGQNNENVIPRPSKWRPKSLKSCKSQLQDLILWLLLFLLAFWIVPGSADLYHVQQLPYKTLISPSRKT